MSIDVLKKYLREDDAFTRYKSVRATASAQMPYDVLCDEIERIQVCRQARASTHDLMPKDLLSVSMDEVSHRARLTEVLVQAKRCRATIQPVVDGMWNYIASTYFEELKAFKTAGQRDSAISTVLNAGYTFIANLDSLIDQCELVIKEIDQTSFALTRAANLMELTIRRENIANVSI